jgi:signal peptidase I
MIEAWKGWLARAWKSVGEPIAAMAFVFASTTAIAQPFYVPSGSMEPTLQIGDAFLGSKFAYGYSRYSMPFSLGPHSATRLLGRLPSRGDVVVFRHPVNTREILVKRVVGLPGDTVQMIHGRLFINGRALPLKPAGQGRVEDGAGNRLAVARYIETLPGGVKHPIFKWRWDGWLDNTAPVKVPSGYLFMMGDNRDNSLDSRVPQAQGGVGLVPVENLMARADLLVGSYDYLNAHAIWTWLDQIRLSRFFRAIG